MAMCLLGKVEVALIHSLNISMLALLLSSDLFWESTKGSHCIRTLSCKIGVVELLRVVVVCLSNFLWENYY